MAIKEYPLESWMDPRIVVRPSKLGGKGLFASVPIRAGEVVIIWGGKVFTGEQIASGEARKGSIAAIGDGLYLAGDPTASPDPSDFMNHSCDPNIWMRDEVTLVARRDIGIGEELTADYAMWEGEEDYVMPWRCGCGSPLCRGTITGKDWRLKALQQRYKGHFSPFINRRIEKLVAEGL
jgi:SET domain-containing protein